MISTIKPEYILKTRKTLKALIHYNKLQFGIFTFIFDFQNNFLLLNYSGVEALKNPVF